MDSEAKVDGIKIEIPIYHDVWIEEGDNDD
jgi:hypothetical protein